MKITNEVIQRICLDKIIPIWESQSTQFPNFLHNQYEISDKQKGENQKLVDDVTSKFRKIMAKEPKSKSQEEQWKEQVDECLHNFIRQESIIGITSCMSKETYYSFEKATRQFVDKVFDFDNTLSEDQIWQALRNYFIYAMIVELQGEKQNAADPILAYSLLYPYTDNYIDDKTKLNEDKTQYNQLIADKLQGKKVTAKTMLEEKTSTLLDMILDYYHGNQKDIVTNSILALLKAQHQSISQLSEISEDDIIKISTYKGSTSVLVDYLFSTNTYDYAEVEFYLMFGFVLQLADDFQDVLDDEKNGSHTVMTIAKQKGNLEQRVNQLLWYTKAVIEEFCPKNPQLHSFVLRHCLGVTLRGIAKNEELFSKEYVQSIESYLPFSVKYLRKIHSNMKRKDRNGFVNVHRLRFHAQQIDKHYSKISI